MSEYSFIGSSSSEEFLYLSSQSLLLMQFPLDIVLALEVTLQVMPHLGANHALLLDDGRLYLCLNNGGLGLNSSLHWSIELLVHNVRIDLLMDEVLLSLMDHCLLLLVNDLLELLMNNWLFDLMDVLLVDDWLMDLMDYRLMSLLDNVLMALMNNVLVMFMDNVLMLLIDDRCLHVLLNDGGQFFSVDFSLQVSPLDLGRLVVGNHNCLLIQSVHNWSPCASLTCALLKSHIALFASKGFVKSSFHCMYVFEWFCLKYNY